MRGQRGSSWARGSTRQTTMPCVSGGRHAVQNTWSPCGISSSAVGGSSHAPLTSRQGRSFTRSMAQPVCLRDVCAPAKPPDITRGIKTIFIVSLMCSVVVSDSYHFRDKKKNRKKKKEKKKEKRNVRFTDSDDNHGGKMESIPSPSESICHNGLKAWG